MRSCRCQEELPLGGPPAGHQESAAALWAAHQRRHTHPNVAGCGFTRLQSGMQEFHPAVVWVSRADELRRIDLSCLEDDRAAVHRHTAWAEDQAVHFGHGLVEVHTSGAEPLAEVNPNKDRPHVRRHTEGHRQLLVVQIGFHKAQGHTALRSLGSPDVAKANGVVNGAVLVCHDDLGDLRAKVRHQRQEERQQQGEETFAAAQVIDDFLASAPQRQRCSA
mmetsp:Transcript_33908/g.96065  ORF Transcript_33908/g.96065 Transcript_33908/m.96065 type:complete len:220 (+) Transcript_33908:700-1359(+)